MSPRVHTRYEDQLPEILAGFEGLPYVIHVQCCCGADASEGHSGRRWVVELLVPEGLSPRERHEWFKKMGRA